MNNCFNHITDSNIVINNINNMTPPQLSMKLGNSNIIGRKKELIEIKEKLNVSGEPLLIQGIGGLGKSTISSAYLHKFKNNFKYYGFFEGIDKFLVELKNIFNIESDNENDTFMKIISKLNSLEGKKLLIIDDIKDIEENQKKLDVILDLKYNNCQILLTSREVISNIEIYPLNILSIDDAKALFNSIYKVEDEVLLEEVLVYLDFHAFFIMKTANSIKKNLSLQSIKEKFENGDFSKVNVKRKESFNELLKELFSFDKLDKEENYILRQLSVLPTIEISLEFLEQVFKIKDSLEFEELLDYLCDKGWIIKEKDNYKVHQIIKEYILCNHPFSFKEVEILVDSFLEFIGELTTIQSTLSKRVYLPYLDSIACAIKDKENIKVANLIHCTGYLNFNIGNYKKASKFYDNALEIRKKVLDSNHLDLAVSYGTKASIYELNNDIKKALKFHLLSLDIRKKNLDRLDTIPVAYNNVGRMYEKLDNNCKAYFYLTKSLKLRIKIFGQEDESTARAYNVLGAFFQKLFLKEEKEKFLNKGYELIDKSLNIRLNILSSNHPDIAISYSNIAFHHLLNKDYTESIKNYNLALSIYTKDFSSNLLSIGKIYICMSDIFIEQNNLENALKYKNDTLDLWYKVLEKEHPYILKVKKDIEELNKIINSKF